MTTTPKAATRRPSPVARWLVGLLAVGCLVPVVAALRQEGTNDLALLAGSARAIDPAHPPADALGQVVTVTGPLTVPSPMGDRYLRPGPYLLLERRVETLAWAETRQGKTATYERVWTTNPPPSEGFRYPDGHGNPPRRLGNDRWMASVATIGAVTVPVPSWAPARLALTPAQVRLGRLHDDWVYPLTGDPARPRVGDARLAYWAVTAGAEATAIGVLGPNGALRPFRDERTSRYAAAGGALYDVLPGSRDEAIEALRLAYPPQPNWPRRMELLGWLFVSVVAGRYALRRRRQRATRREA